jgi:hypothetical protein
VLFPFTLVTAAYRWGFAETVATAGAAVALLIVDAALVGPLFQGSFVAGVYEPDRLIMRSAYLLLAGVLMGYLAQKEKQFRSEIVVIGAIIRQADVRAGFKKTMAAVFDALLRLFDAWRSVLGRIEPPTRPSWEAGRPARIRPRWFAGCGFESASPAVLPVRQAAAWHTIRRGAARERWMMSRWIVVGRGSARAVHVPDEFLPPPSPHSIS